MARTGRFKCPKCDRMFSMAPHLGRHLSTIHGAKKRKTKARKKAVKRAARTNVGRTARSVLRQRGTIAVGRAIHELRTFRDELAAQRAQVGAQIAAVEGALAALGAAVRPAMTRATSLRRGAGPRQGSLKDHIARVLGARRGPMAVKDITAAVRKAGYPTRNKTLDKSVGNALGEMRQVVKVARGQYRLRS